MIKKGKMAGDRREYRIELNWNEMTKRNLKFLNGACLSVGDVCYIKYI